MAYQAEYEAAMQLIGQDDQFRKGTWLEEEDERLISFVQLMGDKKWDALAKASGKNYYYCLAFFFFSLKHEINKS